jgi:purine-binding chemotaxis protein CheW
LDREIREIKVVCFRLGKDAYALDIMRVREILKPQRLSGLPVAPSFVEGVINLRGSVIPVVDLRKRFGIVEPEASSSNRLLITVIDRHSVGLMVDSVSEVVSIPVRDLRPPPALVKTAGYRYLIGVCLVKDAMLLLVNPDTILADSESEELGELRAAARDH